MISLLSPIQRFGVGEVVLGVILIPVGDLGATCFLFFEVLERHWNFRRFYTISRDPWI